MPQSVELIDMIKDFDDPIKQLSRFAVRDFVSEHKEKPPQDLTALIMPSWQGLDIRDITDPLGMQRQNIVAVERKKKILSAFVNESPYSTEVNTELADIVKYLRTTERRFDIIYIDWCSNMTFDVLEAIGVISGRGLLYNGGILVTNVLGERERKYASFMMDFMKRMHDSRNTGNAVKVSFGNPNYDMLDNLGLDISSRDEGITYLINSVLFAGKANTGGIPVLMASPTYGPVQELLTNMLEGLRKGFEDPGKRDYFEKELAKFQRGNTGTLGLHLMHATDLMTELASLGLNPLLGFLMVNLSGGGYKPLAMKRYDYESNTGAHMFMDVMKLGSLNELLRTPEYTLRVELDGERRRFFLNNLFINSRYFFSKILL